MSKNAILYGVQSEAVPHIIENNAGDEFPARAALQFKGAVSVEDTPGATVVLIEEGRRGLQGKEGPQGPMPSLSAGLVSNLPFGSPASAEIIRVQDTYTLNLGIPGGAKGNTPGFDVHATTLEPGEPASAVLTPGDVNFIEFGIPRGIDGITSASVDKVLTLNAGTPATVGIFIDPADPFHAEFDFGIPKGTTYTPSIDSLSNITWTNDGGLPNPESVNIKGIQGEQGIQGEIGPRPEMSVKEVQTVLPDEQANVLIEGGPEDYQMTFQIPQGFKGDKGDKGDQGIQGPAVPISDDVESTSHDTAPSSYVMNQTYEMAKAAVAGGIRSVNGKGADVSGNVTITSADVGALSLSGGTLTGSLTGTEFIGNLRGIADIAGFCTGNSETATSLATGRYLKVLLSNTGTSAAFNGLSDVTNIAISGTLGVPNGGTGVTTLTGLVKGNGASAFSAAVAGTDYVVPTGNIATATKFKTPVVVNFTGGFTASFTIDGSVTPINVTIPAIVANWSL